MIKTITIENYKALKHVTLELTPIHALIGPNDSGKTSILNALAALSRSTDLPLQQAFDGAWEGRDLVWHGDSTNLVGFDCSLEEGSVISYHLTCHFSAQGRNVLIQSEWIREDGQEEDCRSLNHATTRVAQLQAGNPAPSNSLVEKCRRVHDLLTGVHYYRWNPRMLALPVAADSTRRLRMKPDGFGLALMLDDILGFDREVFSKLETKFRSIFPEISSIKLVRQPAFRSPSDEREQVSRIEQADGKGIVFELSSNKQLVPASQASDGVLLILAYLAILFSPEHPRLVLVEEPENGIHPRRLREVMQILRAIVSEQSRTQVVLTTHSPHAVDLLSPDEVTLCTKAVDGSVVVTRLADSPSVKDQLSIFTLGEIWTAEGDTDLARTQVVSGS
jgi:predicted ATPase